MSRRSKERRPKATAATRSGEPSSAGAQSAGDWRYQTWLAGVLLVACVLLAYYPAWHAGFIWDDDVYVTTNKLLTAPDGLWRIWFSFDSPSQYFPLVYSTFRLEHALWGLAPAGYHGVNILLHGVNALLLWWLLTRLNIPGAWLGAAIFALHPVQVESVAWVTELKNVQMGFFFLLSLLAWTEYLRGSSRAAWFYGLSLLLYALALCSKTTACTLPVALVLIAWLRGERIGWRRLMEIVPFLALGIGMGVLTIFWERYHQGTQGKLFDMGLPERLLTACRSVWFYAYKLAWPGKLTFSYPRWTISAADPIAWEWLVALGGVGWAAFYARRYVGRGAFAAFAFFVATLGPVLGFFMLYTFRYTFVADHYQYLACIGPIALVAAGIAKLHERCGARYQWAVPAACAGLLCGLGALTWMQNGTYRNADTLWRTTIARNPDSWMAHNNLGHALYNQGRMEESIAQYDEALRADPTYVEALNNLGNALLREGRIDDAMAEYRASLASDPGDADTYYNIGILALQEGHAEEAIAQFDEALKLNPGLVAAHIGRGNALLREGRAQEAGAQFEAALQDDPDCIEAHCNIGNLLLQQGRVDEAVAQYNEALRIDPACANANYNLGNVLLRQGRADEAIARYRAAVQADPTLAEAHNNLGNALLAQGDADEAIAQYQEALRVNPRYVEAENNLGKGFLQEGRTTEAIEAIRKALVMQPANAQIQNNLAWLLACSPQTSGGDRPRAVQLATEASQATGGTNPLILRTLAAAYAGNGQYRAALETAQTALQLALSQSSASLADDLRREIKLYAAGQPFRAGQ